MLVFLFSGVNFLLLLFFTSIEIGGEVDISIFVEFGLHVFFIED